MSVTTEPKPQVVPLYELLLSDDGPAEESDGLIWKDVLREGEFPMTPALGGPERRPFRVVAEGASSAADRTISMSDLITSFNEKAFQHVTVPTRHRDDLLDNTGFVKSLRTVKKNVAGKLRNVLQAGLAFTEPDIEGKVKRGTIPNVSCGIFFDFVRKADEKRFPVALKHVALTHTPWIDGLEPFNAIAASDEEIDSDTPIEGYMLAEEGVESEESNNSAEIVWTERDSLEWQRREISSQLNPPLSADAPDVATAQRAFYYVEDIAPKKALVVEEHNGNISKWVVPFEISDDELEIAPSTRWVSAKQVLIAASDNIEDDFSERTSSSIKEKLSDKLAAIDSSSNYKINDISLDGRASISNVFDGHTWIARFYFSEDQLHLSNPVTWKLIATGNKENNNKESQQKQINKSKAVHLSDRLENARMRRRKLLEK